MKEYSIYRNNAVIYKFVVDDTISKSLSGNKYVPFTISSKNELDLKIGDYILVGNEKYEIFEPIDIEESNGVFTYPLTFYFQGYKLNNSIITDEGATTFTYHGEVSDFMTLLIDSLNADYPEFSLGTIENGSILDLNFDNSNCMAALQTVCENAEMEWDITGTVITVKRRIGEETDYVFEYGKNKGSYSVKLAKVANASVTTRMIGKGGTLNLPADYDSPDSPKRLNLGDEVLEKNVEKYGKITGVYVNENIYPRLINKTVLGVTIPPNIAEAGSWKIKLDIPFNLSEYYAENEVPVVKFQTGDLTGLDFEIVENSWNNTDKTLSIIVKEEEDGYYIPNANRQPRVGDVFVLLNINMPQSYIDEATQELREATQNELNKKCEPQYAPSLSVQKHYIKKNNISLNIGDGITVKIGSRRITTRIIGLTETSDDIRVELGDQMLYTYDTKVNNTIEQIQFTLKQLINIDDIKRLFYNLINAWYPKWFNQKLHKDADVEFNSVKAAELVQSDNLSSKNFTSGPLGSGHRIKDGDAEFQNLTVRGQFSVFEFLIQQVKAIGGKFCVSPASIRIGQVEETEDGYKCSFNTDGGTIINPFVVGDQAFHQVFDGSKMKRYWRLVTEVGADYFVLSKTDCEANSGIPESDEEIVLLGNRTDINRMSAIMISAYDNNSPYIAFYNGINSYSFEGKEPMRTGNLNGIVDEDFGQLTGFGLYCQNVYMKGVFRLMSGKTVEQSISDSVKSGIDGLQIGGTNMLSGTTPDWIYSFNSNPVYIVYAHYLSQLKGERVTFSGYINGINAHADEIFLECDILYADGEHEYYNSGNVSDQGDFEVKHVFSITLKNKDITCIYFYLIFRGNAQGDVRIKQFKLETGEKATSWSPAPEDTQNQISAIKTEVSAEIKAESDKINLSVSEKIDNQNKYIDNKTYRAYNIDATSLDPNTYYPVTIRLNLGIVVRIEVYHVMNGVANPPWGTHESGFSLICKWTTNGNGWGTIPISRNIEDFEYDWSSVLPVGDIGQLNKSNEEYIYVRGGTNYEFKIFTGGHEPILHTEPYTVFGDTLSLTDGVLAPIPFPKETRASIQILKDSINLSVEAPRWASGTVMYGDPTFKNGVNGVLTYNYSPSLINKVERISRLSDSPINDSDYNLKVTSSYESSPGGGGFYQCVYSRANAIFVHRFIAKIPEGYSIRMTRNQIGDGGYQKWATDNRGTGKWQEYIYITYCGLTGVFADFGYVYLEQSATVEWYLAYSDIFDITEGISGNLINQINISKEGIRIAANRVEISGATIFRDSGGNQVNIFGSGDDVFSINNGVFRVDKNGKLTCSNAVITGNITATTLNAIQGGKIGPYNITSDKLSNDKLSLTGEYINYENTVNGSKIKTYLGAGFTYSSDTSTSLYIENNIPSTLNKIQCCAIFKKDIYKIFIGASSYILHVEGNTYLNGSVTLEKLYIDNLSIEPSNVNKAYLKRVSINIQTGELFYVN